MAEVFIPDFIYQKVKEAVEKEGHSTPIDFCIGLVIAHWIALDVDICVFCYTIFDKKDDAVIKSKKKASLCKECFKKIQEES